MKLLKTIGLIVLLPLFASCLHDLETNTHLTSYKQLKKHFSDPPPAYRTIPFWVWNGEITREMIDQQMVEFKSRGMGGVFIHPRYGLITAYASDEWYDMVQYAVKRGFDLDMKVWLYDENSFPSGFAGGLVPAEMPESYNQGHALRLHRQSRLQPDTTLEYLHIFMKRDTVIDITGSVADWEGKRGTFLLFEKVFYPVRDWYAGFSYVDLLVPGVTEKFIDVTMTGYEERIGREFGDIVPGVFTDEPNIAPQGGGKVIRWTPDLYERFYDQWGYRLEPHLESLLEETGDFRKVRHNYHQLLLDLFIERWSKPWYAYCEQHNLDWTGHYWEHGWPSPHHGPDNMAMYAWHQVPGIDMLFNTTELRPDQFGNVRAVRELNSVANQLSRVRRLSETYGASGYELTFEDMKRNGDWQYALGVNLMNQHLSYQTIVGDRKHDFPQTFSYHAPWWDEYGMLADYYGRLSLAMATGEQHNHVLVMEPTTSAWMMYAPENNDPELDMLKNDFDELLEVLEREQVEYDLGCEQITADHGRIENGKFVTGDRQYSYVVLPAYMKNLNSKTAGLIEEYLVNGGTIIAMGEVPEYVDGNRTDRLERLKEQFMDSWIRMNGADDPRLLSYLVSDEFTLVEQLGGEMFHMRRELEDGQLLFLNNFSQDENCSATMIMQGTDMVELDLFTGSIHNFPCVVTEDVVSFDVELPPAGSVLLFISDKDIRGKRQREIPWRGEVRQLELKDFRVNPVSENALTLDYCYLTLNDSTSGLTYFYNALNSIYRHHGFDKNPWVSASQFKTEIIDRDTFPVGTGFRADFPFYIDSGEYRSPIKLAVERPHLYSVYLNGNKIEPLPGQWWIDRQMGVFQLDGVVQHDTNMIRLEVDPMSVFAELAPVYLLGDFDVLPRTHGWFIGPPVEKTTGSWKKQGLPFYHDRMEYSATFNLDMKAPVRVELPDWYGTLASVKVNGSEAGSIIAPPYELRIDDFVKKGSNTITVEVFGSLKNLLGPHHNVQRRGIVTPWSFKYAPHEQPPGEEYDLLDYGLFGSFRVFTMVR